MRKVFIFLTMLIGFSGCTPPPTPLPVALFPTTIAAPTEIASPRLRYALTEDAFSSFAGRDVLGNDVEIIVLPDIEPGSELEYEAVVALGSIPGMIQSPSPLVIKLILNLAQPPLDNPEIARLVQLVFSSQFLAERLYIQTTDTTNFDLGIEPATIRIQLANLGYPDGLPLDIASVNAPKSQMLPELLSPMGIDLRIMEVGDVEAQSMYHSGAIGVMLIGSNNDWLNTLNPQAIVNLSTIPISYSIADGIEIIFDSQGFPIPVS